ncbi:hypothetical protein PCY14_07690 [Streptococcus sp. SV2]|uniref:hypothetical protein n=1 Tax=unclassified Streptococcus TaxID=2608887 RepID=UPI00263C3A03|nr:MULTISPECIES: hypothetical protein [unclassified Streptococcus]MDN5031190.1 hypothetical protein [Streptococcus sp. SV1]MDN5041313.1 hypothetical protein [Streptococcus sp. SV2]
MKQIFKSRERLWVSLFIISFAILLVTPQLFTRKVILGSDSIFHYNRFYEAAMQLKNGNFSYFLSLYGFQQSGRIVNALYGPFFAYLQGGLILISGTWFRYQIVSRVLLHILAESSMYALLKQCKVKTSIALSLGLLYATTFSIQYWTMRQGFSSWGAALLPYCFIPAIHYVFYQRVDQVRLALSMALIFQIHVLSALMLAMMYLPFYLYTFVKATTYKKKETILKVLIAVILFLLLTVNVWGVLLYLRGANHLLDPFINREIGKNGIDGTARYWLYTPISLMVLLILQFIYAIVNWKKLARWKRILHFIYFVFFFLSTGLFPWQYLVENGNTFAELIQFPFRFFVPATILLLAITGLTVTRFVNWRKSIAVLLFAFAGVGLIQNIMDTTDRVKSAAQDGELISIVKHTYVEGDYQTISLTMNDSDLSQFLNLVVKSTPDYVPIYGTIGKQNTYDLYYENIVMNQRTEKLIKDNYLVLTWQADEGEELNLPIVVYKDSILILNGKELDKDDYNLSTIGTPTVSSQEGKNKLELRYQEPEWLFVAISAPLVVLGTIGLQWLYTKISIKKVA